MRPDRPADDGMLEIDGHRPSHQRVEFRRGHPIVAEVSPGERFRVRIPDSSSGQLNRSSSSADLKRMDLSRVDAAVGPIRVAGAKPGDALALRLHRLDVGPWGWSGVFREFGWLRGEFEDELVGWSIKGRQAEVVRGPLKGLRLATSPMLGWVGVAPRRGTFGMISPRRTGGNLDCPFVRPGARLELPVEVPGAELFLGDPHARQGFGEVCGTGIETPATAVLSVDLRPHAAPLAPRIDAPRTPRARGPVRISLGVAPRLELAVGEALENALRSMEADGWSRKEAYLLASLTGDLAIAEVVDRPNFVVTISVPRRFVRRTAGGLRRRRSARSSSRARPKARGPLEPA